MALVGDIGIGVASSSAQSLGQNAGTVFNFGSHNKGSGYATNTGSVAKATAAVSKGVAVGYFWPLLGGLVVVSAWIYFRKG